MTFTATGGARLAATGCTPSGTTQVTCTGLTDGQQVHFVLVPDKPAARTTVAVTARAAAPFTELDDADNAVTTTLAPDVVLESVLVTGHRDVNRQALVRVQVAPASSDRYMPPSGASTTA